MEVLLLSLWFLRVSSIGAYGDFKTPPLVQTGHGLVTGSIMYSTSGRPFLSFRGIPYAQPPVGHLRFKVTFSNLLFCKHGMFVFLKYKFRYYNGIGMGLVRILFRLRNGQECWMRANKVLSVYSLMYWPNGPKERNIVSHSTSTPMTYVGIHTPIFRLSWVEG